MLEATLGADKDQGTLLGKEHKSSKESELAVVIDEHVQKKPRCPKQKSKFEYSDVRLQ